MIRVKAAFFSVTGAPPPNEDIADYLRWHLLDDMPEQYQLPGIVHAMRWIADGPYSDHRLVGTGSLEHVGTVMKLSRR